MQAPLQSPAPIQGLQQPMKMAAGGAPAADMQPNIAAPLSTPTAALPGLGVSAPGMLMPAGVRASPGMPANNDMAKQQLAQMLGGY